MSSSDIQRRLRTIAAGFAKPCNRRAATQLLNTALPFVVSMVGMFVGLAHDIWWALLLSIPAGAMLLRLFMIQHDCGHGTFFRARWANNLLGRAIGVVTLTPYDFWRTSHAHHHASSGNLDRRGIGDVTTLTVREYLASPRWRRFTYRFYRHPVVLFGIGPTFLFVVRHRIPTGSILRERQAWISVLGTNVALAIMGAALIWWLGLGTFLLGYGPVALIAATAGVWLFYVQHQFEDTHWASEKEWEFGKAAIEGSSYYDMPRFLHWVTGNIGFHHIHHLSSRIPNYRLRDCFEATKALVNAKRLTVGASLRAARLALWCEHERKLVTFRHARRRAAQWLAPETRAA